MSFLFAPPETRPSLPHEVFFAPLGHGKSVALPMHAPWPPSASLAVATRRNRANEAQRRLRLGAIGLVRFESSRLEELALFFQAAVLYDLDVMGLFAS